MYQLFLHHSLKSQTMWITEKNWLKQTDYFKYKVIIQIYKSLSQFFNITPGQDICNNNPVRIIEKSL